MANRQNGEVSIKIGGKVYTLALSLNAMASLEEKYGMRFDRITKEVEEGSITHLRSMIWATLQKHHPDLTVEQVGDLVTAGNLNDINGSLTTLSQASGPDKKDIAEIERGKKANPIKARARVNGTGESSTSARDVSV